MCEVDAALRHPDLLARGVRGDREREESVVGEPDVLGRDDDKPPGDVEWVFAGGEHA